MVPITANILQPLVDVFETVLKFFHDNAGLSWGMSIIALTVLTRALLIPLTYRQLKGMRALQALQPQIKEIQAKYKNDKQRMQQEMMRFYQENKVNPFSSCLPLVAQLPVFISLFYMLRQSLRTLIPDPLPLLASADIPPTARAEEIPVEGFVALARAFELAKMPS